MIARAIGVLVLTATLLAGCSAGAPAVSVSVASPFAPCPAGQRATGAAPTGSRLLPAISLPCFTGGEPVDLAHLGRPAVLNFWASSCAPCRAELPALQRFADAHRTGVLVIGVNTADGRSAAASAGTDLGVSFPAVFDPRSRLLTAWGRTALPVTLLVDATGAVRHEDVTGALTESTLEGLAHRYLAVPG